MDLRQPHYAVTLRSMTKVGEAYTEIVFAHGIEPVTIKGRPAHSRTFDREGRLSRDRTASSGARDFAA